MDIPKAIILHMGKVKKIASLKFLGINTPFLMDYIHASINIFVS